MKVLFFVGDILSNMAVGAVVGVLCAACVGPWWAMLPAMVVGMIGGMALAFVWGSVVGIWLGAHEAMVPAMLTSMVAGMVVAMRASAESIAWGDGALLGAALGLACLLLTYLLDAALRGETSYEGRSR